MHSADSPRGSLEAAFGTQYRLERLLGRGGMGAVYLAREMALDREVAIKVLPPEHAATEGSRERFRREARTAAKLTHPNIVPLHTFGDASGVMYLVMGYVRGESLAVRLRREGRLPLEATLRVLLEIADALDYAHRQGVVHRDVKPDNVLIDDESGRAMLTDFGVARAAGAGQTLTATGAVLGTPHYMSPEQASGRPDIDGRSDVYSLGVMAYTMLAGRLPFEGESPGDVIVQRLTRDPPPLAALAPDVPDEVVAAVTRCLARDPAARWPDAGRLRDALRAAGAGDELPEALQGLDGRTQFLLAALWVLGNFMAYGPQPGFRLRPPLGEAVIGWGLYWLFASIVGFSAVVIAGIAWRARRRGFLWPAIARAAFRQPSWWPGWYPRALRRPGDVWPRLPAPLRRPRILAGTFLAYMPVGFQIVNHGLAILFGSRSSREGLFSPQAFEPIFNGALAMFWVILAVLALQTRASLRWLRERLAAGEDALAVLRTHTGMRSFWQRPGVAAVLLPGPGARGAEAAGLDPHAHLRAIGRAAAALTGPARVAADEAARAAETLVASLAALDREIDELGGEADAAEQARLEEKLAALGGGEAEPESRRQMRELLQRQLDLLRSAAGRLAEAKARRDQNAARLRALWSEVESLARLAPSSREAEDAVARVRTLCLEDGFTELPTRER